MSQKFGRDYLARNLLRIYVDMGTIISWIMHIFHKWKTGVGVVHLIKRLIVS